VGLIYLDSCILIYTVEEHPINSSIVRLRMNEVSKDKTFAVSPLVKLECQVRPFRDGDAVLEKRYGNAFARLFMLSMPVEVYSQAARLRARFSIRTPDALHLACAQYHECDSFWTNDKRLDKAARGLALDVIEQ
jgi:predicted nucleic acid-binding protein